MREVYHIYGASYPDGSLVTLAISEETLVNEDPEAFFVPGLDTLSMLGEIEIDGDTHLLPDSMIFGP